MDPIIQHNIDELIVELRNGGIAMSDPVSKLMVTTLIHQAQKIKDEINRLPELVVERLASYYIPRNKVSAMPSICLVKPTLKQKKDIEPHKLSDGSFYTYKIDSKLSLTYYPLFRTKILPVTDNHIVFPPTATDSENLPDRKGQVWVGIELATEIDSLANVSFLIKGTAGIMPEKICVGNNLLDISYVSADRLEDIPMMEPFDTQQTNPTSTEILSDWKTHLSNLPDCRLIYINDSLVDRDIFKCKSFPKGLDRQSCGNGEQKFNDNTLWLLFDFGSDYEVPAAVEIIPNVFPVVNVCLNSVTLTQSSPVAKLTKNDGSYFLNIVETTLSAQKQGFSTLDEDVVIRDFDSSCYNPEILYRDVRNLYYRFIDDYHAFVEYHGLKDGELLRSLREIVNRVGKSVTGSTDIKNKFDEGTYAMRNVKLASQTTPVKVSYLTTHGRLGNSPKPGTSLENKKDVAIEKDVAVITQAIGGENKATPDQLYDLLRYFTLTNDRLYTKMDIDAFLRIQLAKEFGNEETKRIGYDISIQGAAGPTKLMRGLYIDIKFKDAKIYNRAVALSLDKKLQQQITDKSCISMPISINLIPLDL